MVGFSISSNIPLPSLARHPIPRLIHIPRPVIGREVQRERAITTTQSTESEHKQRERERERFHQRWRTGGLCSFRSSCSSSCRRGSSSSSPARTEWSSSATFRPAASPFLSTPSSSSASSPYFSLRWEFACTSAKELDSWWVCVIILRFFVAYMRALIVVSFLLVLEFDSMFYVISWSIMIERVYLM